MLLQMDMDYIDSSFDYDVENEDFYEVSVPAKGQKRRVTFKQQVSTKVSEGCSGAGFSLGSVVALINRGL